MTPTPDPVEALNDIAAAIDSALAFVTDMDAVAFAGDQRTVYAVIYALTIVGEAAKRIPPELRTKYPETPWRLMAGMRDRLIHGYMTVDASVVWKTVTEDLPLTKGQIAAILRQEQSGNDAPP